MSGRRGTIGKRTGPKGIRWHYVLDVDADEDGKRKQKFKGGYQSEQDAIEGLREAMAEIDRGEHVDRSKLTVREYLLDKWLPAQPTRGLRASTLSSYESLIRTHVLPGIGGVRLQKLTPDRLNTLYGKLRQPRDGRKHGLKPRSIRLVHTVIRRSLEDARRWGYVTRNVADLADPPSPKSTKPPTPQTWTAEEASRFLRAAREDRLYAAYHLALVTGARRGEVLGAEWGSIDLEAKRFRVTRSILLVDNKIHIEEQPKTEAGKRTVSLDAGTVDVLRAHRRRQAEERLQLQLGKAGPRDLVFAGLEGEPVHPTSFLNHFNALARKAGVPVITLRAARHTYATLGLEAGLHPKVVQERLGHSSIAVTMDTYSHVSAKVHDEAAGVVAGLFTTTD